MRKPIYISFLLSLTLTACGPNTSTPKSMKPESVKTSDSIKPTPPNLPSYLVECAEGALCEHPAGKLSRQAMADLTDSIEPIELSLDDILTKDSDQIALGLTQQNFIPNYNTKSVQFIEGLRKMHLAYDHGHPGASNELGLIYFQIENLKDLAAAKVFFETAVERGEADGHFNLARLYLSSEYRDESAALENMKAAAKMSRQFKYFRIQMQMALEAGFSPTPEEMALINSRRNSKAEMQWRQMFEPLLTQTVEP